MHDFAAIADAPLSLAATDDGVPRSRIQVAELGSFSDPGRYGDFAVTAADVASWQKVLADHFHGEVPIDVDHHTDRGISSEAAGWIKGLTVDGNRVLADVEWTDLGAEAIRSRRYKFVSPTFVGQLKDKGGKDLGPALLRAGLTNSPFLHDMPALSLSADVRLARRVEAPGPFTVYSLALGLAADATEDDIIAEVHRRKGARAALDALAPARTLSAATDAVSLDRSHTDAPTLQPLMLDAVRYLDGQDVDAKTLTAELDDIRRALLASNDKARTLATTVRSPIASDQVDDEGEVLLRPDVDVAELQHDAVALTRAFRRFRALDALHTDLTGEYGHLAASDLETFTPFWLDGIDRGVDPVATLERQVAEVEAEAVATRAPMILLERREAARADAADAAERFAAQAAKLAEEARQRASRGWDMGR
jgi:phage I-like protein